MYLKDMIEEINTFIVNEFATNCYIYKDPFSENAIIIDPGGDAEKLINFIENNHLKLNYIFLTHAHYDHIGALEEIYNHFKVEVVIHQEEYSILEDSHFNLSVFLGKPEIKGLKNMKFLKVKDLDIISCGSQEIFILHTPGHTKGGICLYIKDRYIFTGDTLFCGSVGRTDFPTGDIDELDHSLKRIFSLPHHIRFFPGHNNSCILKEELKHNPFL
ncbi:MAG: MBL fold metallo-hydrolase [Endomicrobia bacterium]|nr:MBL fold metallo-hydrolase [Endomicrobiia bacterium]